MVAIQQMDLVWFWSLCQDASVCLVVLLSMCVYAEPVDSVSDRNLSAVFCVDVVSSFVCLSLSLCFDLPLSGSLLLAFRLCLARYSLIYFNVRITLLHPLGLWL